MNFEKGYLYHIYNQGNNRQTIFFKRAHYLFFLKKIRTHILPHADLLAYCLMPNHFHLMVLVKEVDLLIGEGEGRTSFHPMTSSHRMNSCSNSNRSLNQSIAILLRSYTRAINKELGLSGSLFRQKTKAECINNPKGLSPSFITQSGITKIVNSSAEKQYPQVCFNYIHQNPVKAGLVKQSTDWEFSSAKDYANLRKGRLINKTTTKSYINLSP